MRGFSSAAASTQVTLVFRNADGPMQARDSEVCYSPLPEISHDAAGDKNHHDPPRLRFLHRLKHERLDPPISCDRPVVVQSNDA